MFFYSQSDAAAASRTIGGITYTANTVGSAGNNIAITHTQGAAASAGTKASTTFVHSNGMQSASFIVSAKNAGTSGNRLRISFSGFGSAGGTATYAANQVGGTKDVITVPGMNPSLAQVRQSLAQSPASTYVDVTSIVGAAPMTTPMFFTQDLSGGTASVAAESTAVTVNTATAITVRIAAAESDVATVAAVVNAAGTSVTASGTGTITDKNITLLLQGGAD